MSQNRKPLQIALAAIMGVGVLFANEQIPQFATGAFVSEAKADNRTPADALELRRCRTADNPPRLRLWRARLRRTRYLCGRPLMHPPATKWSTLTVG